MLCSPLGPSSWKPWPSLGLHRARPADQRFNLPHPSFPTQAPKTQNENWCDPAAFRGAATPQVLVPFDRREAITTAIAARIAGRAERRIREWCEEFNVGRRIANGPWRVSRVALAMLLDGDDRALAAYLAGDRSSPLVLAYYERLGLGTLIRDWSRKSAVSAEAAG